MTPIACVALLGETIEEGAYGSWPTQRVPSRDRVESRKNQIHENRNSKGNLAARLFLSLFLKSSQWSNDSLRGTVRRGANRSCLPKGKARSLPKNR